jgi:hypothetical protein
MLVVDAAPDRLRLVRQADHARLAGQLAARWGNDRFAAPMPASVVAADLHDEGWVEPDARPLLDPATRRPLNFLDIDLRRHAGFYGEAVRLAQEQDPYAGLLVSMHWTGLYCGRWGWQSALAFAPPPELRDFLDGVVTDQQHAWIGLADQAWDRSLSRRAFERNLWADYELLQVWDILSLFLCRTDLTAATETQIAAVPRDRDDVGVDVTVRVPGDGSVTLDPYPFGEDAFDVAVPAREIADRAYPDEAAAAREIDGAGVTEIPCRIAKA